MPKFRHVVSGIVVDASDRVGERLGSDWAAVGRSAKADVKPEPASTADDAAPVEEPKRKPGRPKKS